MQLKTSLTLLLLSTALFSPPVLGQSKEPTQRQLSETGPQTSGGFGSYAKGLGDIDGDGFDDYGVSAPAFLHAAGTGRVYLYSGRTGLLLKKLDGDQPGADFGLTLANVGDVNGDGQAEIAVGAPRYNLAAGNGTGRLFLFDSATGAILWTLDGESGGANFGLTLGAINDTDADGVRELVVGAPGQDVPLAANSGRVYFVRGDTGVVFGWGDSPVVLGGLGKTLATRPETALVYAGMTDGAIYIVPVPFVGVVIPVLYDSPPPGNHGAANLSLINLGTIALPSWGLIIGRPDADTNGLINNGTVEIRSAGGSSLMTVEGTATVQAVGIGISHVADVDDDGSEDFVLASGVPGGVWFETWYRVMNLAGTVLDEMNRDFGEPVLSTLRDVTGDGRGEWLSTIASGVALQFDATVFTKGLEITSLDIAPNGALNVDFAIDLNAHQGGRTYFQIYSFSGVSPGVANASPGAPLVPINLDTYSALFTTLIGTAILPDAIGTLGPSGLASTSLWLPPNAMSFFSGLDLATTVISTTTGPLEIHAATNPLVIEIP